MNPNRIEAENPLNYSMANYSQLQLIDNVQSGGYIQTQYMALLDDYNQTVTVNNGAKICTFVNDTNS